MYIIYSVIIYSRCRKSTNKDAQQKEELKKNIAKPTNKLKKSARKDRKQFVHDITEEAETAARQYDLKELYEISRIPLGKYVKTNTLVRDKQGMISSSDKGKRTR